MYLSEVVPADMVDVVRELIGYLMYSGYPPMARVEAASKWWRSVRPYFLGHRAALTDLELRHVERYRPDRWLDELHPYKTETHLFGRDLT